MKKFYLLILILFIFPFNLFCEETFLSLKKNKVNVRYGPSFESPIKYIYKKIHLPIKQIDKKENWRRIIDLKNNSGWIHVSQLKKVNSLKPLEDKILFKKPSNFSRPIAMIKEGRVLIIKKCEVNWGNVKTKKISGWIKSKNIWGIIK